MSIKNEYYNSLKLKTFIVGKYSEEELDNEFNSFAIDKEIYFIKVNNHSMYIYYKKMNNK